MITRAELLPGLQARAWKRTDERLLRRSFRSGCRFDYAYTFTKLRQAHDA